MAVKLLRPPLTDKVVAELRAGDPVLITGELYAARDAVHKLWAELLKQGRPLPVNLEGQIIYYVGPSPARAGRPVGAAGPTTSGRMDPFTPQLLARTGLKAMIGKGSRSEAVKQALIEQRAVYLAAVGGAGALLSQKIRSCRVVAYPELGPEALQVLEVEDFPAVVINDCYGGDLYVEGRQKYARR
ncbi:MAG: FumA C-terminus/TtdB family hydratase beta subunit [Clostridia bacterium]|jgi:fumarate hydratase subunit beta|nr:FumA C-terminus/TtdB family hydratase beta subunit [Clostridia bacterium]MDH7574099.1 FumA C-terminus/TtdB family hydratase beta subunit [Clostridia bacterium]